MIESGMRLRAAINLVVATLVLLCAMAQLGRGLSYGTAGNSATIHGSSGLYRPDRGGGGGGYLGGRSAGRSRSRSRSRYSSYGGYSPSSGSADEIQKETKYYYGGKYQGSCVTDGLYYRDDTTFVICSNGYPHEQPCPPGTKTSGSPRYQPGYYYGYTDLCSVNLVDYGYGPEYYAPRGYPYISPDHRERGGSAPSRPHHVGRPGSAGGYGGDSRPVAPSGGAASSYSGRSSSPGEGYPDHSLGSYGVRESTYGVGSPSKASTSHGSRASSGGDYSSSSSSGYSGSESLSAYQRESSPSRLTYRDVKAPYLHDSAAGSKPSARSNYYGGSSSYGGGYDSSYKPQDSLYPSSQSDGKQY